MHIKHRQETNRIVLYLSSPEHITSAYDVYYQSRMKGSVDSECHYVIERDGMIDTGRPLDTVGNFRRSMNKDSVFVCLISEGKFPSTKQKTSLKEIIEELQDLYPNAKVERLFNATPKKD